MSNKLNLNSIKEQAKRLANDEDVQNFVNNAKVNTAENKAVIKVKGDVKIMIDRCLKDRNILTEVQTLNIKKNALQWIDKHAFTGKGGKQSVINFLLEKGIESIEETFKTDGMVVVRGE